MANLPKTIKGIIKEFSNWKSEIDDDVQLEEIHMFIDTIDGYDLLNLFNAMEVDLDEKRHFNTVITAIT